jgi:hypothetical protein
MFVIYTRSTSIRRWSHLITHRSEDLAKAQQADLIRSGQVRQARIMELRGDLIVPNSLPANFFKSAELAEALQRDLDAFN